MESCICFVFWNSPLSVIKGAKVWVLWRLWNSNYFGNSLLWFRSKANHRIFAIYFLVHSYWAEILWKKMLNNKANENLDLTRFFKNVLIRKKKQRFKKYSIFCFRILYIIKIWFVNVFKRLNTLTHQIFIHPHPHVMVMFCSLAIVTYTYRNKTM